MTRPQKIGIKRLLHAQPGKLYYAAVAQADWPTLKAWLETSRQDYLALCKASRAAGLLVISPEAMPEARCHSQRQVPLMTTLFLTGRYSRVKATIEASETWSRQIGQGQIEP